MAYFSVLLSCYHLYFFILFKYVYRFPLTSYVTWLREGYHPILLLLRLRLLVLRLPLKIFLRAPPRTAQVRLRVQKFFQAFRCNFLRSLLFCLEQIDRGFLFGGWWPSLDFGFHERVRLVIVSPWVFFHESARELRHYGWNAIQTERIQADWRLDVLLYLQLDNLIGNV